VEWRNDCKSGTYINEKRMNKMMKNQRVARKGKRTGTQLTNRKRIMSHDGNGLTIEKEII
jgi:hypothetical protein